MDRVANFYDANADYEWHRLERHPHEFALSLQLLREYLPTPPARVLDVGGGPGRYALALSALGYAVTLFDLSAACLDYARARAAEAGVHLADTVHGNALDLGALPTASFDAVLVMGPLYHLLTETERSQALQEAYRVLKPGGVVAVAFLNRLARIRRIDPSRALQHRALMSDELATGMRRDLDGGWTDAYTIHPDEVRPLLEREGFTWLDMIVSEGVRDVDEPLGLSSEEWTAWIDLIYPLAKDPTIQGAGIHLLAVCRK